ncbi:MAG: hypothetical protein AB8B77_03050, partial [Alphaproteobacteria bacterium]
LPKPSVKDLINADIDQIVRAAEAGEIMPVDPETAEYMGAIEEEALGAEDAEESRFDHLNEPFKD